MCTKLNAKLESIEISHGDFMMVQGVEKDRRSKGGFKNLNHGMGSYSTPAAIHLWAYVTKQKGQVDLHEIAVNKQFRENFKRYTDKFKKAVKSYVPKTFIVKVVQNSKGENYFEMADGDINNWIDTVKQNM